ncbi:MAG: hypothetical protein Q8840_02195, partial [Sweet potato little leaf phytoplasma]|nr:hypothetical protein [Sweet potato little leaf phytoplasma]
IFQNMIAEALRQKAVSMGSLASILVSKRPLAWDIQSLANSMVRLDISDHMRILASVEAWYTLFEKIRSHQCEDIRLQNIRHWIFLVMIGLFLLSLILNIILNIIKIYIW